MSRRRALVVDDDAGIRLLVKRVLQKDFDVDLACDGGEAIEKILTHDYDVIVLDIMMPRINGITVVRYLAEHLPARLSHVIVVTAFGPSVMGEVCPPIERFLEKPFDLNQLLSEVSRAAASVFHVDLPST